MPSRTNPTARVTLGVHSSLAAGLRVMDATATSYVDNGILSLSSALSRKHPRRQSERSVQLWEWC